MKNLALNDILQKKQTVLQQQQPGIYFLINDEEIVYVGQSINPEKRIDAHYSSKIFNSYTIINCKKEELDNLEKKYISKFLPKYNMVLLPTKNIFQIGKVTKTKNKHVSIPCLILNNRLYINLSNTNIEFIK